MDKIIVVGEDNGGEDNKDEDSMDEDNGDEDNGKAADMNRDEGIHSLHKDSHSSEEGGPHDSHSEVGVRYSKEQQHLELPLKKVQ